MSNGAKASEYIKTDGPQRPFSCRDDRHALGKAVSSCI